MSSPLPARVPVTDAVAAPHRLAMGLVPLTEDECWVELDEDLERDLREKRRLLVERRQVFVELATSREVQREALELLVETLLGWHPSLYARKEDQLELQFSGDVLDLRDVCRPALETAALCVQEDLCVMQQQAGRWCLEKRNHLEDYRRAFGEEPPTLQSLAVMVDTDNTKSEARAWFQLIRFLKGAGS